LVPSQVFQIFEDSIAGMLETGVSGGNLDLSGSPRAGRPVADLERRAGIAQAGTDLPAN